MTGLQKQNYSITFGQGLDTKTDPKLVVPGKLLELENTVFKKGGSLSKRNGYSQVSSTIVDGTNVPVADALGKYNEELLLFGANKIYSYSESTGRWIDKGNCSSFDVSTKQIVKNTHNQTQCDSAYNQGISVYGWVDSRGGVYASVYDETTNTPILVDQLLDSSASRVKCLAFAGYLYVFYYVSGNLKVRRVNPQQATSFDSAVTISTSVNTSNPNYDVSILNPTTMIWAHNDSSASTIKLGGLDYNCSVPASPASITIAESATNSICLYVDPNQKIFAFWHNASGLRYGVFNNGFAVLKSPATVDSYTSTVIRNITAIAKYDNTTIQVYYEVQGATDDLNYIKTSTVTASAASGSTSVFQRGCSLWSKAWRKYLSSDLSLTTVPERNYVGILGLQQGQSTYFIIRSDGYLVAKMQPALADGKSAYNASLQNVWTTDDIYSFSLINKVQLTAENGGFNSVTGVARTSCDFSNANAYINVQVAGNTHIGGGILNIYDGQSVIEHGFHYAPVITGITQSTGGSMSTGNDYYYIACYEWTDNAGQRHISQTSDPFLVHLTGSNSQTVVTISTLRQTEKYNLRTAPIISLWRTEAAGSIYYRVSSTTSPTYNDKTVDTVTIADTLADTAIISNELLYTTGGVLDNSLTVNGSMPIIYKDRLFVGGTENKNEIFYSKPKVYGQPVELAIGFTLEVDPQGGDVTAMSTLDDKLIFFKKERILLTVGDGPNATGTIGGYNEPQLVSTDSGCTVAKSIAYLPDGIIRMTKKGIYKLNSALQNEYIGAPVEAFNGETITQSTLKADRNQIRFLTSTGSCLVYDYYFGQWSTFTNHKGVSSLIWNDTYIYLNTVGKVLKEVEGFYKDIDSAYTIKIVTSWLSLAGISGFKRVYDIAFLADYKSSHILSMSIGYDFAEAWLNKIIFSPDSGLDINTYGQDATYGSSSPYGGINSSYQFKASMQQQKCTSIKFKIEELTTSATDGTQEGFTMTALSLSFGVKGGLQRFRANQSIGTEA